MDRESVQTNIHGSVRFGTDCQFGPLITTKESPSVKRYSKPDPLLFGNMSVTGVGPENPPPVMPLGAQKVYFPLADRHERCDVRQSTLYGRTCGPRTATAGVPRGGGRPYTTFVIVCPSVHGRPALTVLLNQVGITGFSAKRYKLA